MTEVTVAMAEMEPTAATMAAYQAMVPLNIAHLGTGDTPGRREYAVTFIEAGYVMQRNGQESNWRLPAETLQASASLLNGVACFVDHADWFEMPSLYNLAGVCVAPHWRREEQRIDGVVRLYDRADLEWLAVGSSWRKTGRI